MKKVFLFFVVLMCSLAAKANGGSPEFINQFVAQQQATLDIYKFDNQDIVKDKGDVVYTTVTRGIPASTLRIESILLNKKIMSALFNNKVTRVEMQYLSPATVGSSLDFTKLYGSDIKTYLIYPVVYKDMYLKGFFVIGYRERVDIHSVEKPLANFSTRLAEYLTD